MLRRLSVPMLIGACAALAFLTVLAAREPLTDWRTYLGAAALGAAYVLLLYPLVSVAPIPSSTAGSIGCGCGYAAAGYFFLAVIAFVVSMSTDSDFAISSPVQAIGSLIAFAGLGLLGGSMFARFRRAEQERQRAALERQQLELARDLQQRLLPPPRFESDRFRIEARNVPAAYVAGDFYDIVPLPVGRVLIVVADVSGKGVAAGMIMATVKAMIPLLISEDPSPASLLMRLNERLRLGRREFIAIVVALLDDGKLSVANAGMPDPLHIAGGSIEPITVMGPRYPLGVRERIVYDTATVTVAAGDRVFFFSDGLPEATIQGDTIGYERVTAEVKQTGGDLDELFRRLEQEGAAHDDDWTAVTLEIR